MGPEEVDDFSYLENFAEKIGTGVSLLYICHDTSLQRWQEEISRGLVWFLHSSLALDMSYGKTSDRSCGVFESEFWDGSREKEAILRWLGKRLGWFSLSTVLFIGMRGSFMHSNGREISGRSFQIRAKGRKFMDERLMIKVFGRISGSYDFEEKWWRWEIGRIIECVMVFKLTKWSN